jgi:DNA-binding NarL/FixJ family response regulator
MLNIAIADEHLLFSRGLKKLLETERSFNVVEIAKNGDELIDIVSRHNIHLAIVDLRMPAMEGMAVCKELRSCHPNLKIIMLSVLEETSIAEELKNVGVDGYIYKTCEPKDFIDAIYSVCGGHTVFPEYSSGAKITLAQLPFTKQFGFNLTSREKEIISLISRGFTSPAIASKLFISINTVKGHRKHILKKLYLNNAQGLVAYAITHGLC